MLKMWRKVITLYSVHVNYDIKFVEGFGLKKTCRTEEYLLHIYPE